MSIERVILKYMFPLRMETENVFRIEGSDPKLVHVAEQTNTLCAWIESTPDGSHESMTVKAYGTNETMREEGTFTHFKTVLSHSFVWHFYCKRKDME